MGRESGRLDHLHNDVLGMVLCVVWIIELSPTHTALERLTVLRDRVAFLTVTVLDAAQDDRKES